VRFYVTYFLFQTLFDKIFVGNEEIVSRPCRGTGASDSQRRFLHFPPGAVLLLSVACKT
jgi:hypothetical protein